ncbi:YIP1 family protein [Cribrihabitans pelagius]|uniref:YIP1 family protein n=1 Tax=Cribrihabitans pelagius TaxID=1765746 RepID=UPI003B5AAF72
MSALADFALLTVKTPGEAARRLLERHWSREALWTAFLLSVVLNTLVYTLQRVLFPLPPEALLPRFSPGVYFGLMMVVQFSFIAMLTTAGRWLGGAGDLRALLVLVVWLQLLQAAANAAVSFVFLLLPLLAAFLNLGVSVLAFFILLHFVKEAHSFGSVWRALGVVVMASLILLFAAIFLAGLIGPANLGLPDNV